MYAAISAAQIRLVALSAPYPAHGRSTTKTNGTTTTATPRPAHAAIRVARSGSRSTAQTTERSTRPPSSGSPGSRLKAAMSPFVMAMFSTTRPVSPLRSNSGSRPTPIPASRRDTIGPATATEYSRAGVCGCCVTSVAPARKLTVIRRTGRWNARATRQWPSSCSSTETPSSTANDALTTYAWLCPSVSTSGWPYRNVMTTAITNHDGPTKTGTPATRPRRTAPRGVGSPPSLIPVATPATLRADGALGRPRDLGAEWLDIPQRQAGGVGHPLGGAAVRGDSHQAPAGREQAQRSRHVDGPTHNDDPRGGGGSGVVQQRQSAARGQGGFGDAAAAHSGDRIALAHARQCRQHGCLLALAHPVDQKTAPCLRPSPPGRVPTMAAQERVRVR